CARHEEGSIYDGYWSYWYFDVW
nr:immunoglobulin heavy chain junction region [Mus musculus]